MHRRFCVCFLLLCAVADDAIGYELANARYRLVAGDDPAAVTVQVSDRPPQTLRAAFTVLVNEHDPGYTRYSSHPNYPLAPRIAIRWRANSESVDEANRRLNDAAYRAAGIFGSVTADDAGAWTWQYRDAGGKPTIRVTGPRAKETLRPTAAGRPTAIEPVGPPQIVERTLRWSFTEQQDFTFAAEMELPPGDADPRIRFTLTPKCDAYFAVLYDGMPRTPYAATIPVPQETMQRGHKLFNYVFCESDMHLPRAHVATQELNLALVADPRKSPFRLPNPLDSRFGLMLRHEDEQLQPVLMAPLLGGAESKRKTDEAYSFTMRAVVRPGDWKETFRHIARNIYGVRDERDNSGPGSLNGTIERILDFLADRDGRNRAFWHDEQKYYDYYVDQSNVFKPFSPLFGLSAALVTDDDEFYRRRALPAVEFALSRKYNLFAPYEGVSYSNIGSAKSAVGGPYLGYAQLLALDELLQRRSPAIVALAEEKGCDDASISDLLAKYRRYGDADALAAAEERADSMITRGAVSSEAALFDLLELYDVTRDERHLRGVVDAAYHRLTTVNLFPQTPDATVTADPGGRVPIHLHSFGRHKNVWGFPPPVPIQIDEQHVPAWRLSRVGVPSIAYPMEYWMNYYGGLMRAAALADDDLLRNVARNGIVGRFGQFPGDNRSQPSLVGELPDVTDREPWEWNFTTMNPCHAWDFVAWLIDFLVSDAFDRSNGAIDFPAETTAGSNFRCRVYGARPGKFYGDDNVRLWLPRGLVECDNKQFDWLAGHGNNQLYLAFWNQSAREESATVTINERLAGIDDKEPTRTWRNNQSATPITIRNNLARVVLPPKALIAFAMPIREFGARDLVASSLRKTTPTLGPQSFEKVPAPFGVVRGMMLGDAVHRTTAYIYTDAPTDRIIRAKLRYRIDHGEWAELTDEIYPFEFSLTNLEIPTGEPRKAHTLESVFEVDTVDQKHETAPQLTLDWTDIGYYSRETKNEAALDLTCMLFQEGKNRTEPKPFVPSDEFLAYMKTAANPKRIGFVDSGRCMPYATPLGRRIGWRAHVADDAWYRDGISIDKADADFLFGLRQAAVAAHVYCERRNWPTPFHELPLECQEMLVDFVSTEWITNIDSDLVDAILAQDWRKLIDECLYVRYYGPSPDQSRNKAFADRWIYSEKLVPLKN